MSRCHARAVVGDSQAALADCNQTMRLAPPVVPATLETRGLVLLKLGRLDEAIADYDAALNIYARSAIGLYSRGVARRKKGDIAGSDTDITAAKAIRPGVGDLFAKWGVSSP
jgi:tetratricopeptide (TPR) repeat protein